MRIRWIMDTDVTPWHALAAGEVVYGALADPASPPVVFYGASVQGNAMLLGRWARSSDAVNVEHAADATTQIARRTTGGPPAHARNGVIYCALALRHASALIECAPDRIVSRNVRGLVAGLGAGGAAAHYSKREYLSIAQRPTALIGWTRSPEGRVLIEAFLSHTASCFPDPALCAYPLQKEPPLQGKQPIVITDAWEGEIGAEELIRHIVKGHAEQYEGVALEQSSWADAERTRITEGESAARASGDAESDDETWKWSSPVEVPVGFVSAAMRLDDAGMILGARVAGDFSQDEDAARVLSERLTGQPPDEEHIDAAVRHTWDGTSRVIEGLEDLQPLTRSLLAAARK